jgi:hypothetical protein
VKNAGGLKNSFTRPDLKKIMLAARKKCPWHVPQMSKVCNAELAPEFRSDFRSWTGGAGIPLTPRDAALRWMAKGLFPTSQDFSVHSVLSF